MFDGTAPCTGILETRKHSDKIEGFRHTSGGQMRITMMMVGEMIILSISSNEF